MKKLLFILIIYVFSSYAQKLTIYTIDVGQADALLLCFENGKNMMIDMGGKLNSPDRCKKSDIRPFDSKRNKSSRLSLDNSLPLRPLL